MTVWCDGHNCDGTNNEREDRNISQDYVAHVILDKIRDCPNAQSSPCFRLRSSIRLYMRALKQCNNGSKVQWKFKKEDGIVHSRRKIFRYVFWHFGATRLTFQDSHPVVTVDATHLRGTYKGKAIVAVVKIANNRVVPIVYAIIDEESNHSWYQFLKYLKIYVLHDTFNASSPNWRVHRYCMEHVRANLMSTVPKKKRLYGLSRVVGIELDETKYMKAWTDLIKKSQTAGTYLQCIPLEKWTLFHDGFHRWGTTTSNDVESYNNVMRGGRFLPIRAFDQATHAKAMAIFADELMKINRYRSALVPIPTEKFDENKLHSRRYIVSLYPNAPERTFSVRSPPLCLGVANSEHTVQFDMGSCTYLHWNTYMISYSHAMVVAKVLNVRRLDLIHRCYTRDGWRQQFNGVFGPLPNYWLESDFLLLPDDSRMVHHTGRGRKRVNRRQLGARDYANRTGRRPRGCSFCNARDHDRKKCPFTHTSMDTLSLNMLHDPYEFYGNEPLDDDDEDDDYDNDDNSDDDDNEDDDDVGIDDDEYDTY
ncbi:uncharacterized protein [Rutidosis leptorrhynchoides]|uniref:uncharacterized protein n=1 Tax=Rutidosis leptorrhynchoides TaxID=125765 RepID=UPI003A99E980